MEARRDYLEDHDGGVYQSKPSYSDLRQEAKLSWPQPQAVNPNEAEAPGWQKPEEIKKKLAARQADIVSGEGLVFAEEEWHFVWGDTLGYVGGRQNERTEVPLTNVKQRQS